MRRTGIILLTYILTYLIGGGVISTTKGYEESDEKAKEGTRQGWLIASAFIALGIGFLL